MTTTERRHLGPEELALAGSAFETALPLAAELPVPPHRLRSALAREILRGIFAGASDPQRVVAQAIERLAAEAARAPDRIGPRRLRVLVAEDEYLVASELEGALAAAGARVIGPTPAVSEALALIDAGRPDGAILDLSLADGDAAPIAEALLARGVPIVVHSARGGTWGLPESPLCRLRPKPVEPEALVRDLLALAGRAGTGVGLPAQSRSAPGG